MPACVGSWKPSAGQRYILKKPWASWTRNRRLLRTILALPKEAETDNLVPFLGLAFRTMPDAFDT
jgi:hypothetical protein